MKKTLYLTLFTVLMILMTGCKSKPAKAAGDFMESLQDRDFTEAAACCGVSKDKASQQIVMAMLTEKYGMPNNSIRSYEVKKDTILDNSNAIAFLDLVYTNNTYEKNVPIKLTKMGKKWVVAPFED